MTMFEEVADIKTADELDLDTPNMSYETVVVKPTELQQEMVQVLAKRADWVRKNPSKNKIDNMLKITSDGN